MINFLNKYNLGKGKLIGLAILAVLLVALPVFLLQVQNKQVSKQRASASNALSLLLDSSVHSGVIGQSFSANLNIQNPSSKNISAVDTAITYDPALFEKISFIPNSNSVFSQVINDPNTPGMLRLVVANAGTSNSADSMLSLGKITFQAKSQGTGKIAAASQVAVQGETGLLAVNDDNLGSYTISAESQAVTGQPIAVDTSSPSQVPSPAITVSDSNYNCYQEDLNNDGVIDGTDVNLCLKSKIIPTPGAVTTSENICGDKCAEEPATPKGVDMVAYCSNPLIVSNQNLGDPFKQFMNVRNNKDNQDNRYLVFVSKTSDEDRSITIKNLKDVMIEPLVGNTTPYAGTEVSLANTAFVVHGNPEKENLLGGCFFSCKEKPLELYSVNKKVEMYPFQDCSVLAATIASVSDLNPDGTKKSDKISPILTKISTKLVSASAKVLNGQSLQSSDVEGELKGLVGELKSAGSELKNENTVTDSVTNTLRTASNSRLNGLLSVSTTALSPSLIQAADEVGAKLGDAYSKYSKVMSNKSLVLTPFLADFAKETDNSYLLLASSAINTAKLSHFYVSLGLDIKAIVTAGLQSLSLKSALFSTGNAVKAAGSGLVLPLVVMTAGTTLYCDFLNKSASACGCRISNEYDDRLVLKLEKTRVKKGDTITYQIAGFEDCPTKLGISKIFTGINVENISSITLGINSFHGWLSPQDPSELGQRSSTCKFQANGKWCLGEFKADTLVPGIHNLNIGYFRGGEQYYSDPSQTITVE